ncbi:MAG TPA: hypothetical protein PK156_19805 [Polyangium sp.]|nr:hypothetical protein [Polyangium sp.]
MRPRNHAGQTMRHQKPHAPQKNLCVSGEVCRRRRRLSQDLSFTVPGTLSLDKLARGLPCLARKASAWP